MLAKTKIVLIWICFYSSRGQESEIDFPGLKSRSQQGFISFEDSRVPSISLPFSASRRHLHSLASIPFHLQNQQQPFKLFSCFITLTPTLLPSSVTYKDLSDYIGSTWVIQDTLPISKPDNQKSNVIFNMNPPWPCNKTYLQIIVMRKQTCLRNHYSSYHWQDKHLHNADAHRMVWSRILPANGVCRKRVQFLV